MGDTQRSKDYYEVPLSLATNTLIQKIANGQLVVTLHGRAFSQVRLNKVYFEVPLSVATNTLLQKIASGQLVITLHGRTISQVR